MARCYLLVLPLCLILQDQPIASEEPSGREESEAVQVVSKQVILQGTDLLRQKLLGGIAFATPQAFPGSIPWGPMHDIGTEGLYPVDFLIHYHPALFLEMCLERYEREVTGYSAKLIKRERLGGKLVPMEKLEIHFRERPFSVHMNWLEGAGLAKKVLYVAGENDGKILARASGLFGALPIFAKDVDGADAKRSGRFTIDQFGIYQGTKRTLAAMNKAQRRGTLHVAYKGTYQIPQLGGRECYVFVRTPYEPPEDEGIFEYTIYVDKENWLQVGSLLKDVNGNLIGEYFFKDVKVNPEFKADQFTRAAL